MATNPERATLDITPEEAAGHSWAPETAGAITEESAHVTVEARWVTP